MTKLDEIIALKRKKILRANRLDKLQRELNTVDSLFLVDIYSKVLFENDNFELKVSYCVHHGFSIGFDSKKDSKYSVYKVFSSYSWFYEWVSKIHTATEITNLISFKNQIKEDLSNLEDIIKSFDKHVSSEYVLKRYESLFEFISSQVMIILGNWG